jgi:hypothetical protein
MQRLVALCLSGCSVLGQTSVKTSCTRTPVVIDVFTAAAGAALTVKTLHDLTPDEEAHGLREVVYLTLLLPTAIYGLSAAYGYGEMTACEQRRGDARQ